MTTSRSLCILDTNVLIDLYFGSLLEMVFELPYRFATADVLLNELDTPNPSMLHELGLLTIELSGDQVQYVYELVQYHSHVSVNDLFALVSAVSSNAVLITGDKNLRQLALRHNIRFHGTLWILDEMVRSNILEPVEAGRALRKILNAGSRLPLPECQRRFREWESF